MSVRSRLSGFLILCVACVLIGCGNPQGLDSVAISPTAQALSVGQTAQFTATGTFGNANHSSTQNITSSVTWSSSSPSVVTVNASGLATAVGAGSTTITASAAGYAGPVSSSATIAVASSGGGSAGGSIVSISVIPGSQSVASPAQTSQFLAIGTTSSGATVNLTGQVTWSSSSPSIATIGAATGLATAMAKGSVTIAALYSNAGTVVTGTATFIVIGGTTQQFTSLTILPSAQTLTVLNQQAQFIALATSGSTGLQQDVTSSAQIKWTSSAPTIGSVNSTGVAKDLSTGLSTITAVLTNSDGSVVTNSATLTTSLTAVPADLLSLSIIPSTITEGNLQESGQFLAIGNFSTPPYTRDLTNSVQWITSAPNVFPVTTNCGPATTPLGQLNCSPAPAAGSQNGGVATAYGIGSGVIVAEYKGTDGSTQVASANFACPFRAATATDPGSCNSTASALLSTLTVYNEGLNNSTTNDWQVTAPSVTSTPNVLHCGPGWPLNGGAGGSVCTETVPVGSLLILTAAQPTRPAGTGTFGGWSVTCKPSDKNGNLLAPASWTAAGPNYCVVNLTTDETVGAIFNQ
jgi:uncharacterized protein YjdB